MSKSARIELRAEPEEDDRIRHAARLVNQSKTAFIMTAAVERADDVIANWSTTAVSPDFFDQLLDAFDRPDESIESLAKAVQHRRLALEEAV